MTAVLNQRVRVAEGVDDTIIVMGVWCPKCLEEVGPVGEGICPFCDTRILDEDKLSARAMLAQLRGLPEREPAAALTVPEPGVDLVSSQAPSRSESPHRRPGRSEVRGRPKFWTRDRILNAYQGFHAEHGRTPSSTDCEAPGHRLPGAYAVRREFGTFVALYKEAGLEPPQRGGFRGHRSSGGTVGDSAVTGSGDALPLKELAASDPLGAAPLPVPSHPEGLTLAVVRTEAFIALNTLFDRLEAIA